VEARPQFTQNDTHVDIRFDIREGPRVFVDHIVIAGNVRTTVNTIERELWTPLGLRSLAATEPHYAAHYRGGVWERDGSYHQGTVWPWLAGPFIEAWVKSRGGSAAAKAEARIRFLNPLLAHLSRAGLGHVSEIADAESPHTPRGCPFQAWSLAELLRLERQVLALELGALAEAS